MTHGRVYVINRAEVDVPEDVFQAFGHTEEYTRFSIGTSAGAGMAGQDSYSKVIEWMESSNPRVCMRFLKAWDEKIAEWQARLADSPETKE